MADPAEGRRLTDSLAVVSRSAVAILIGTVGIATILWDAFETILLPRRASSPFRISRFTVRSLWQVWAWLARSQRRSASRENLLGLFAMLSMVTLLWIWAFGLILAFALLHWATGSRMMLPSGHAGFLTDLYMSGTTFFTLGLGDIVPASRAARVITVIEAGMGFGFLALVVSYLPVLYSAFSRRESRIVMLDEWAGSPPSATVLLRRSGEAGEPAAVTALFRDWEVGAAELLESHLSYPVLAYFRSQHDNQSWLAANTTVLDAAAVTISCLEGLPLLQARLTFAMGRHALVDLSQVFRRRPIKDGADRLPAADLERMLGLLAGAGFHVRTDAEAIQHLTELRAMYEPYALALSRHLLMPLPGWLPPEKARYNWQTTAWARTGSHELH